MVKYLDLKPSINECIIVPVSLQTTSRNCGRLKIYLNKSSLFTPAQIEINLVLSFSLSLYIPSKAIIHATGILLPGVDMAQRVIASIKSSAFTLCGYSLLTSKIIDI